MPKSIALRFREKTKLGFFGLVNDEVWMPVCAAVLTLASSDDRQFSAVFKDILCLFCNLGVVSTQVKKLIPSFPQSKHSSPTLAVPEAKAFLAFSARRQSWRLSHHFWVLI
jgi:hypothetical protein